MISKPFDQISASDIHDLVSNKIPESKTLEYKQALPDNDAAKREFTADITSFANTDGGDILYGIVEERDGHGRPTGIPKEARGLADMNPDHTILSLTGLLRDTTDPRLTGLQSKPVPGFPDGPLLLLRVPNSWNKPHRVTTTKRFHARSNSGKYDMDTTELRNAILQTQTLNDRIRAFHDNRRRDIAAKASPIILPTESVLIVHLIPIASMMPAYEIEIRDLTRRFVDLRPLNVGAMDARYNLDGFLTFEATTDGASRGYIQVFRNGIIELVDTTILAGPTGSQRRIPTVTIENSVLDAVRMLLRVQAERGIPPPIVLLVTLSGVKNYSLAVGRWMSMDETSHRIDRDTLTFEPILIEDYAANLDSVLRPVFDALWQAGGFNECKHYDPDGTWNPYL